MAPLLALFAGPAPAATFIVSTTADAGAGSLRQAILDANAQQVTGGGACVPHDIVFAIPGNAPHTIQPLSALPPLQIGITIDAFTQPGASPNTLLFGNNAVPGIELDGTLAGNADAFVIAALVPPGGLCGGSGSRIRGFAINRFAGSAIAAAGGDVCAVGQGCSTGAILIQGNLIGTDVTGSVALGNGSAGRAAIRFGSFSSNNIVGDQVLEDGGPQTPSAGNRNVIAGNAWHAIEIAAPVPGSSAVGHRIRGNFIGVSADGTAMLPNGGHGVTTGPNPSGTRIHDNIVAGSVGDGIRLDGEQFPATLVGNCVGVGLNDLAFGNGGHGVHVLGDATVAIARACPWVGFGKPSIAWNAGAGVFVDGNAIVDVLATGIADNGGLGIDLAPAGVNANDDQDPDTGPNELLNTPVITVASRDTATGAVTIAGTLNSTPNTMMSLFFWRNPACDPSGSGEGQSPVADGAFVLNVPVTTDALGNAAFSRSGNLFLQAGEFVTAATRRFNSATSQLETSEFSACRQVIALGPVIFADSFE